jgi:hypothetical protein
MYPWQWTGDGDPGWGWDDPPDPPDRGAVGRHDSQ